MGKTVVLDYGFYDIQGLMDIKNNGIYRYSIIKKRCFWTIYVDGDKIKDNFTKK